MSTVKPARDSRRHRLAANDNETVVADDQDTEGHRLAANDNESVVEDVEDTEGHRLATNDNETTVPGARRIETPDEDDDLTTFGAQRERYR